MFELFFKNLGQNDFGQNVLDSKPVTVSLRYCFMGINTTNINLFTTGLAPSVANCVIVQGGRFCDTAECYCLNPKIILK